MTDSKIARQMRRKRRRKWNGVRFVSIDHPVLDCAPFTALSGAAAKAMLLLLRRWNGLENNNNGRLPLSVRDVKTYCHVGTDKALAVQRELAASKLAVPTQPGGFNFKMRHATEWRVSFLPTATAPATWEFAKAPPENSKHASYSRNRAVPTAGTDGSPPGPKTAQSVPAAGTDSANVGSYSRNTSKVNHRGFAAESTPRRPRSVGAAVPVPKHVTVERQAPQSPGSGQQQQQRAKSADPPKSRRGSRLSVYRGRPPLRDRVLEALRSGLAEVWTRARVVATFGVGSGEVQRALRQLVAAGEVERVGRGVYQLSKPNNRRTA